MRSILFIFSLICICKIHFIQSLSHCPTNVTCSSGETCCQTTTGLWGCCPFNDGICCQDGIHCCPNNEICLSNGTCTTNSSSTNHWENKSFSIRLGDIPCQDGTSCPDGSTCCELASGRYGCCPIANATCCADHLHCCPSDHQCDVEHGRCKKKIFLTMINEIVCPDQSSCPDGETCCQISGGDYACCPLVDAVCCNSFYCCPRGTQCDVEHGQCLGEISIPWFKKTPSKRLEENLILIHSKSKTDSFQFCPDKKNLCPSNSICCSNDQSQLKCCSIESIPQSDVKDSSSIKIIQCPDEKSYCPEETTCCQLNSGQYGCCPYVNANCCSDKTNCCPSGYSCDKTGRCTKHEQIKSNLMKKLIENVDELCPDNITRCSIKSTCCPNKDSQTRKYSCCPYAKGVCCGSNGSLCCPNNYQCDEKQLSCQLQENSLSSLRFRSNDFDLSYFQCSNSDIFCSNDQTCCQTKSQLNSEDQFACCPFKNGICCQDGLNCCPQDTHCDLTTNDCISNY